ncbi:hypothetical protein L4L00_001071 [Salmonella enterica]|nr:hypothetical protein [Salmonella enterica]EIJ8479566.1 hypothetical protein [Salmonella enterica]EIM9913642.1 hypothetical protein [Salmonella enterica]EIT0241022.1 hypothetical protein [Salmonella enterica]EIU2258468.1 hypothetical protein [Salmonella enterica]
MRFFILCPDDTPPASSLVCVGRRHHRDDLPCRTLPVRRESRRVRPTVEYRSRQLLWRQGYAAKAA